MAIDVEIKRRRFTLDEYHRMIETGILHEDDRVELIHGEIIQMTPIGHRHAFTVAKVTAVFSEGLRGRGVIWPQNPITILPDSEPQPDLVVLQGPLDRYRLRLPGPRDVALLIEVADSSVRYDRNIKKRLYAAAGIPECWIVNLEAGCVERYRDPEGDDYRRVDNIGRDGLLTPAAFPELTVSVAAILG